MLLISTLKPEFYSVTTVLWSTADSSHVTAFRRAVQAWASCSVRTDTVDWISKLYLWIQLSFLRNFPRSDTKTSLPRITRPRITAHCTKRQLFFQWDFHIPFSGMVQQFRRFLSQNANCEYTCLLLFLPLIVARTVMMMIMMMSISIALCSTDSSVQSAEGDYFFRKKN